MTITEQRTKPLSGGELNAAISDAAVKVHHQHLGRGPTKTQTFYRDNVVVTIMEEAFTSANHAEPDMAVEIFILDRPVA